MKDFLISRASEASSGGGFFFIGQGIYQIASHDYVSGLFNLLAGVALIVVPEKGNSDELKKTLSGISNSDIDERLRRHLKGD